MRWPKVSVLMPVYNGQEFLSQAINSILNQTYQNFELIIINDGSTDNSMAIIDSFKDKRIRIIQNEKNLGLVKSRNRGVQEATGEYIAMLDCDDLALPDRLLLQAEFLDKNLDYGIVGSYINLINAEGKVLEKINYSEKAEDIKTILFFNNFLAQSSVMGRSNLLKQFKYREEYPPAEDYDLWVRLSRITKIMNLKKVLIHYRVHTNNISFKKAQAGADAVKKILLNQLAELEIEPSEAELDLHIRLSHYNFIKSKTFLNQSAAWLLKLYNANLKVNVFPDYQFRQALVNRFILACGNSGLGVLAVRQFLTFPLVDGSSLKKLDLLKFFIKIVVKR